MSRGLLIAAVGRRRVWIVLAVIPAVIALSAVGVVAALGAFAPGPRQVVADFFAALAARDASRSPALDQCSGNPLCGPRALRTGYEPPRDVTVGTDIGDGTGRLVEVFYTVNGRDVSDMVDLYRADTTGLSPRRWRIARAPGAQITVIDRTAAPITLAAVVFTGPRAAPRLSAWVPSGTYTVTRDATPLLQAARTSVTVGAPATVVLPVVMQPTVTAVAQQLIRDRIDGCAAQRSFTPTAAPFPHGCPMAYHPLHTASGEPDWTVLAYPQLSLQPADDGTVTVTAAAPGKAVIHYQWSDELAEPRRVNSAAEIVEFTVTGRIAVTNGAFEWQPS